MGSVDENNIEVERMSFPSNSVTQVVPCGSMETTGGSIHEDNFEFERMSFPSHSVTQVVTCGWMGTTGGSLDGYKVERISFHMFKCLKFILSLCFFFRVHSQSKLLNFIMVRRNNNLIKKQTIRFYRNLIRDISCD